MTGERDGIKNMLGSLAGKMLHADSEACFVHQQSTLRRMTKGNRYLTTRAEKQEKASVFNEISKGVIYSF